VNLAAFREAWSNKAPILVTGHTGFKGTWLTLLLKELGVDVVGYSLRAKENSMYDRLGLEGNIQELFADIRDEKSFQDFINLHKPSAIIHLAAQPLVIESYKNPKETFEINVVGTANLLQAASQVPSIEAILVSTTDKVYKNQNTGRRFIESDPLEGVDPYSASKVATEAVIRSWQNILEGKVRVISGRAGNVIGGGDYSENRVIPDCVRAHESRTTLAVRNPKSIRPWQHVLEPLSGYLIALGFGTEPAYNFGPKELSDFNVLDVVDLFREKLEFDFLVLEPEQTQYEATYLSLDSTFARRNLKWSPTYTQKQAIDMTGEWWKMAFTECDLIKFTKFQIREFISLQEANA
jgi:CDP-glucose 4,6-dehydratase